MSDQIVSPQSYDTLGDYNMFKSMVKDLMSDGHEGEFVVFHDKKPIAYFQSINEAMKFGLEKYGERNFIAQKVAIEGPVQLYSLLV